MAKPNQNTKVGDVITFDAEARVVAISEDKKTFACVPLHQSANITVELEPPVPTPSAPTPPPEVPPAS